LSTRGVAVSYPGRHRKPRDDSDSTRRHAASLTR
jgi:hypothetical protein